MRGDEIGRQVERLVAVLFDVRAAQEEDLRALTCIQRSLEGVRTGRGCGDADLLLGEMARLFVECERATERTAAYRRSAAELLEELIAGRRRALAPDAVSIVAA